MKTKYESPKLSINRFATENIITTSGEVIKTTGHDEARKALTAGIALEEIITFIK